jgi:asparagine synthase (glutamine-hydrolysing)
MCGIFGAIFVPPARVNGPAALASLHHRGPDGTGSFATGDVLLGHRRLSILDLSTAAAQPMHSSDGSATVVFNGEIYNHRDLRRELEAKGHSFRSRSDTEVIVEGYLAWGNDLVRRLDGMFAFVLYDHKNQRALFARDRAGKKPLFYSESDGGVWFASEPKALFAAGLARVPALEHLGMLLGAGYAPAPATMYQGVCELMPGEQATLARGTKLRASSFWRAPFAGPRSTLGREDAAREVRRLFVAAVERRMEADVPIGAFLSGGVDSTLVVGVMRELLGQPIKTFSLGFAGDARYDETRFARAVAERFKTEHTEFIVDPTSIEEVEKLVDAYDGAFADASAIPTSIISKLTRERVGVALTGDGGDEIFCGYPRFLAIERAESLPSALRRPLSRMGKHMSTGRRGRRLGRVVNVAAAPLGERAMRWTSVFDEDLTELLRDDGPQGATAVPWSTTQLAAYGPGGTALGRTLAHNFSTYLPFDLLVKADRASMMHSLELRSPFLDRELVEFAATLPAGHLRRGRETKVILKEAFPDLLPQAVSERPKMGFGLPLGTWFRGPWRSYIGDLLAPSARCYAYLNQGAVRALLERHWSGNADLGLRLWLLVTLELWLRTFDTSPRPPVDASARD